MKDRGCTERPCGAASSSVDQSVVDGQGVTRRLALAALLVACILPTVLLVGVCSYVHHQLLVTNYQLRQVIHECHCRHPIVSLDRLSQTVSLAQLKTNLVADDWTTLVDERNVTTISEQVGQRKRRRALTAAVRRHRRSSTVEEGDTVPRTPSSRRRSTPDESSIRKRRSSQRRRGHRHRQRDNRRSSSSQLRRMIHLRMYLPNTTDPDLAKMRNNQTVNVDFGKRHRNGFIPNRDHNQNRSLVYRVWRTADWARHDEHEFHYDTQSGSVNVSTPGLYLIYSQLQYQCERMCGYVLMHEAHQLARCVAGRRLADANNLLLSTCSVVTTAVLRRGDRLRLQDVDPTDPSNGRYVFVPATPAETAAANFWGVVKLANLD